MTEFTLLAYREEICRDPAHAHRCELQKMLTVKVYGLKFDVTCDGDIFSVRHAHWEPMDGLTLDQVQMYMLSVALTGGA